MEQKIKSIPNEYYVMDPQKTLRAVCSCKSVVCAKCTDSTHQEMVLSALKVCCSISTPKENDLFDHSALCEQPKLYMHS